MQQDQDKIQAAMEAYMKVTPDSIAAMRALNDVEAETLRLMLVMTQPKKPGRKPRAKKAVVSPGV